MQLGFYYFACLGYTSAAVSFSEYYVPPSPHWEVQLEPQVQQPLLDQDHHLMPHQRQIIKHSILRGDSLRTTHMTMVTKSSKFLYLVMTPILENTSYNKYIYVRV
jgi:hypothetical protein